MNLSRTEVSQGQQVLALGAWLPTERSSRETTKQSYVGDSLQKSDFFLELHRVLLLLWAAALLGTGCARDRR